MHHEHKTSAACAAPPHGPQDWLLLASKRMAKVEYALLLATFALVLLFGLEIGIGVGIVLAALHFAYRWATAWRPLVRGCGVGAHAGCAALCCEQRQQPGCRDSVAQRSTAQHCAATSLQLLARPHDCQHRGALTQRRG